MLNRSRKNAVGLSLLCLAGCGVVGLFFGSGAWASPKASSSNTLSAPRLVALKLHADWCRTCQKGETQIAKVKKEMADESVLFLTFDLTDENTKRQSAYLASMLGMERLWKDANRRVGKMLLIDPKSKREVGVVNLARGATEIRDSISKKLDRKGA